MQSSSQIVPRQSFQADWRAEAQVLAMAIAEAALLWSVVDLLLGAFRAQEQQVPVVAVALPVIVGTCLPRVLEALDVDDRVYRVVIGLAVAASTLFAIKVASFPSLAWLNSAWLRETLHAIIRKPNGEEISVWGMVVTSAVAWWRGKTRAEPGSDAALATLRFGTVVAVVAVIGETAVRSDGATRSISGATILFFGAALAAVALNRLRPDDGRTVAGSGLGSRWLGAMLAPVLVVVVAAIIAAGLLSRDLLDTILWFLSPIIWALTVILRVVLLLLALIAFILIWPILWLLSNHPIDFAGVQIEPAPVVPDDQAQRTVDRASQMPDAIRYLIAAAILLVLFAGVTRLMLRRRRRQIAAGDEERASVLDTSDLLGMLKSLLGNRFGRSAPASDPLAGLRGDPRWAHTVAIRETYGEFLTWSRDQGAPRDTATTPAEHESNLARRQSGQAQRADLAAMTTAYGQARYDQEPATPEQAATVRAAWQRVRTDERR